MLTISNQEIIKAFLYACLGSITCAFPLVAQVIPDRTLGTESSTVQSDTIVKDEAADLIEGGAIRDNILFHSFTEFNVADGNNLYFANPEGIANILTRVTGNNLSEIFGTLGVDGAANLFLLNPNGVVFGENAALNVNGSFLATTAESYIFENDFDYSAKNPDTPPLLTVNLPVGVQFGSNPEAIEVRGVENTFTLDEEFSVITDDRPVGLEVGSDSTLTLLGGEVNLRSGNLTTSGGKVELGAIGGLETVNINDTDNGLKLDYAQVNNFEDINFSQSSSIDVSGSGAGNIQLTGQNISLLDGSVIIANTTGADDGGDVSFIASDKITIRGQNSMPAIVAAETLREATGNAANLIFESDFFLLGDEAVIDLETFGQGDSGDLTINASEVELSQETLNLPFPSGIYSQAALGSTGNTGDISISGDRITIQDGTVISTGTFGDGNVGNLTLNAAEIEITGFFPDAPIGTAVFSSSEGNGNGGNLTLNGELLILRDGGFIFSGTSGAGNGGNLTANVSEIEIAGSLPGGQTVGGLFSSSGNSATGDAGNLIINGDRLKLTEGGVVDAGTFGFGSGGNVTINVSEIEISGIDLNTLTRSSITTSSSESGNAGNLTVDSNLLTISSGGEISVLARGEGDAGELTINANTISLDRSSNLSAAVNRGNRGNINLNTNNIFLNRNSQINAQAFNDATGGNIRIDNMINILLRNNSQINAQAVGGNGGNIEIDTQGFFLSADSLVSASSEFGLSGTVEINTIETDPTKDSFDIPVATVPTELTQTCKITDSNTQSEFTISGRGGLPESPGNFVETDSGLEDWRVDVVLENGSNVPNVRKQYPTDNANNPNPTRIIEAQAWKFNDKGNVILIGDSSSFTSSNAASKICGE